jgi:hypothetical protein
MSTVITDNLTGKTSAGDVTITSEGGAATQSLQQGLAKAWAGYNQTGTPAVDDSLNVASLVDTATGKTFVNFSSNMNNAGYSVSLAVSKWDSTDDGNSTCAIGSTTVVRTTAGHPSTHAEAAVKGNFDTANICSTVHGDLA